MHLDTPPRQDDPHGFYAGRVTGVPAPPGGPVPRAGRPGGARRVVAGALIGLAAVAACGWWAWEHRPLPAGATEPIALPATVAGLVPLTELVPGADREWERTISERHRGVAVAERAYSVSGTYEWPVLEVWAGRTGDEDFGARHIAAGSELRHGAVTCTRTLQHPEDPETLEPATGPFRSELVVVCWRSAGDLTVTVRGVAVPEASTAAAVEEVWAAIR